MARTRSMPTPPYRPSSLYCFGHARQPPYEAPRRRRRYHCGVRLLLPSAPCLLALGLARWAATPVRGAGRLRPCRRCLRPAGEPPPSRRRQRPPPRAAGAAASVYTVAPAPPPPVQVRLRRLRRAAATAMSVAESVQAPQVLAVARRAPRRAALRRRHVPGPRIGPTPTPRRRGTSSPTAWRSRSTSGARISRRYIPYLAAGAGLVGPGTASRGRQATAGTSLLRHRLPLPRRRRRTRVSFASDLSFGFRKFQVSNSDGSTWTATALRVPAPRPRRRHPLQRRTSRSRRCITFSGGTLTDTTSGAVGFGPNQGDGQTGTPSYVNGGQIPGAPRRTTPSIVIGCGAHFDLFGK